MFESVLNSPGPAEQSTPATAFKPSTSFKFGASTAAPSQDQPAESSNLFGSLHSRPSSEKSAETPKAPSFGFTPSSAAAPAGAQETPKARANPFGSEDQSLKPPGSAAPAAAPGGFKPIFSAPSEGSTSFLAAFGKQADAEVEKAKRKRMDEDYDSEDEDQASWEAKDKAEQEAKRRKIEEAAKSGSGFTFKPSTSSTSSGSIFKLVGANEPSSTPAQTPAKSAFGGFSFTQPLPSAKKATEGEKLGPEKEQGSGDNTWKPATPIKFGSSSGQETTTPAAAPPKNPFAGLFGSSSTPAANKDAGDNAGKLAPPSVGFSFGAPKGASTDASRATTPGLTTDGETSAAGDKGDSADGEPSDEQQDKQQEDMSVLTATEREGHDVLLEVSMAKCSKMDEKKNAEGAMTKGWVEKGKGPLYLLKNKETGKARILLKVGPMGRIAMNFNPLPAAEYKNGPSPKFVTAAFVDHMDEKTGPKGIPTSWLIQVGKPEVAADIARILEEQKS